MFAAWLAQDLIFIAIALLWAHVAKLGLGLRAPAFRAAWPWILLYMVWFAVEWLAFTVFPSEEDPALDAMLRELGLAGALVLIVVTGPLFEEFMFRGVLFSGLLRRWGFWAAAIVPSILWGLWHWGYEAWFIASIMGSGVVLAIIRLLSGSLYLPLALHAAGNLLVTLNNFAWLDSRP
ncbi:MAG TPA: CPBP family intramembrane glutamic endopeptidase [Allosphingosinicella sp.]|nr:CPBP family intramembrane glutamic endopeptidase [Allosphingosinicella sp.]